MRSARPESKSRIISSSLWRGSLDALLSIDIAVTVHARLTALRAASQPLGAPDPS